MGMTPQKLQVEQLLCEVLDGGEEQPGIALLNPGHPSDQSPEISGVHWALKIRTADFVLDPIKVLSLISGTSTATKLSLRPDGRSWICSNSSLTNFPRVAEASTTVAPSSGAKLEIDYSHIKKGVLYI